MKCEICKQDTPSGLYQVTHGEHIRKYACYGCVPAGQKAQYPQWQKRQATREKRAELARKNFGHVAAA